MIFLNSIIFVLIVFVRKGHSRLSGNLFSLDLLTDSEEGKQMDVKSSRLLLLSSVQSMGLSFRC